MLFHSFSYRLTSKLLAKSKSQSQLISATPPLPPSQPALPSSIHHQIGTRADNGFTADVITFNKNFNNINNNNRNNNNNASDDIEAKTKIGQDIIARGGGVLKRSLTEVGLKLFLFYFIIM